MSSCIYTSLEQQYWLEKSKTSTATSAEKLEEERAYLKDVFDKVDANGDGNLSKIELMKALNSETKEHLTAVLGTNFFYMYNQVDVDDSGGIDFEEFVNWVKEVQRRAEEVKQQKLVDQYLHQLFHNLDRDRSLTLTLGELIQEMQNGNVAEIQKALGTNFLKFMDTIDHDQNKQVNFVEFSDWVDLVYRKQEEAIRSGSYLDMEADA